MPAFDPMPAISAAVVGTDHGEPMAIVRDGNDVVVASDCVEVVRANGADGFAVIDHIDASGGFWVGALGYEFSAGIETVDGHAADDRHFPDVVFARFARRERHQPHPHRAVPSAHDFDAPWYEPPTVLRAPMVSSLDRAAHAAAVATIHDHLRAGDCYQVNLTRRLSSPEAVDPRSLFAALAQANPAPHALLLDLRSTGEVPGLAIVGASPERFLRIDGARVETRPIKGTHRHAEVLMSSAKDLAEHVMIVDLARNDLGRFAVTGSVDVPALAAIERHPGLVHLVSTVRARRPDHVTTADIVRATFPAASITGAPKPRVMQIIDALEPVRRGFYCGAAGWIDADAARADFAVSIRTFTVSQHGLDFGVGGGIVIDSHADAEWWETELKAARLLAAAGAREAGALVEAAR